MDVHASLPDGEGALFPMLFNSEADLRKLRLHNLEHQAGMTEQDVTIALVVPILDFAGLEPFDQAKSWWESCRLGTQEAKKQIRPDYYSPGRFVLEVKTELVEGDAGRIAPPGKDHPAGSPVGQLWSYVRALSDELIPRIGAVTNGKTWRLFKGPELAALAKSRLGNCTAAEVTGSPFPVPGQLSELLPVLRGAAMFATSGM